MFLLDLLEPKVQRLGQRTVGGCAIGLMWAVSSLCREVCIDVRTTSCSWIYDQKWPERIILGLSKRPLFRIGRHGLLPSTTENQHEAAIMQLCRPTTSPSKGGGSFLAFITPNHVIQPVTGFCMQALAVTAPNMRVPLAGACCC